MKLKLKKTYLLVMLVFLGVVVNARESKTLLVCIDGCNATILDYTNAPVIRDLIDNATFSTKVELRGNAIPTSGWASLLTGAYALGHGVTQDSTWDGNRFNFYPVIFDRMKTETPDKTSTAIVCDDLLYEIVMGADYYELQADDDGVEASILSQLNTDDETDLFFIEFKDVFKAGIENGFGNAVMEYVEAVEKIDDRLGNILDAIEQRPNSENEDWSIIISSNHGGNLDGTYGGNSKSELLIPVIISGDGIDNRDMASGLSEAKADKNNSIQILAESNDDYRYVMINKSGTKLEEMQDFTVEFRVYAAPWQSDPSIIGDKDWGSGGNPGWTVCRRGSSYKFQHADQQRNRIDVESTGVIEDGDWHHVAVSFSPQGFCRVYTDGELQVEEAQAYGENALFASPFEYLAIGNEGTLTYNNWRGIIDEVRIWDVVLAGETIKEFYKKEHVETLAHPNLADMLAYYKMDGTTELNGSEVTDHGPYGYHGTLIRCDRVHVAPLKLTDIHPTVIDMLDGEVKNSWLLNGDVVKNDVRYILGEEAIGSINSIGSHYPNPVMLNQNLNVIIPDEFKAAESADLKVMDINGILYQSNIVSLRDVNQFEMNTDGLKTGTYLYSFRVGDQYLIGKFMVK